MLRMLCCACNRRFTLFETSSSLSTLCGRSCSGAATEKHPFRPVTGSSAKRVRVAPVRSGGLAAFERSSRHSKGSYFHGEPRHHAGGEVRHVVAVQHSACSPACIDGDHHLRHRGNLKGTPHRAGKALGADAHHLKRVSVLVHQIYSFRAYPLAGRGSGRQPGQRCGRANVHAGSDLGRVGTLLSVRKFVMYPLRQSTLQEISR